MGVKRMSTRSRKRAAGVDVMLPILDAVAFMATFTMPDYLIDGIIQRGRLHALNIAHRTRQGQPLPCSSPP